VQQSSKNSDDELWYHSQNASPHTQLLRNYELCTLGARGARRHQLRQEHTIEVTNGGLETGGHRYDTREGRALTGKRGGARNYARQQGRPSNLAPYQYTSVGNSN
jgi:hypothetical protein